MIKECPTCGRTYSDTTISFCLADGALLSAPFERVAEQSKDDRSSADTAVMPDVSPPKPTQASPLPTMTAPPVPVRATAAEESSRSVKRPLGLALAGVAAIVLAIVLGYFLLFSRRSQTQEELAAAHPSPTPAAQSSAMPAASPGVTPSPTPKPIATQTPGKSEPTPSPIPVRSATPLPATLDPDPVLFPPKKEQTDYSKVFSVREVDQPARISSRPKPSYTEEARKNQVQGVVTLRVVLAASGEVTNVSVIRGLPNGLTESAIQAARQIKFSPAQKDGRAVSQYATIEMNFSVY